MTPTSPDPSDRSAASDPPDADERDRNLAARAREHLLGEHREFVAAVLARTDRLDGPDADALHAALDQEGLLDRATTVLETTVGAIGRDLPHEPVGKPPYVVVTSVGLVLRATFEDDRLVATVAAFEHRDGEWVHTGTTPETALRVERRK